MMRVFALLVLIVPLWPATAHAVGEVSPILFLNRCRGGCTVYGGVDDARAMSSSLPCAGGASCGGGSCFCSGSSSGTYTVEEFENYLGEAGAAADEEWNELVQCVREVYSPYAVMVTDVLPANAISHTQGIVAGRPVNIGWGGSPVGGIATNGTGCGAKDNVISFSFANFYSNYPSQRARVLELCSVVAQETAHSFGLEHAYEFSDGSSACSDPMTYRPACGQRFFRNLSARCGEYAARPCACGLQNSHQRLLSLFGPGTPLTPPPTLSVSAPANGATIVDGTPVIATAFAQRGVYRLDLWLNGYKWHTVKGAGFGSNGQPETTYSLPLPQDVPDGIIDIVVKAYDDIEAETIAPTITVTKGAPCTSADTCAKGQRCDAGKCFWDPPTGQVGDACDYPQFCVSGNCFTLEGDQFCTQGCVVGVDDSCPMGFECGGQPGMGGVCIFPTVEDTGCCGVGADGKTSALLSLLVVGFVVRRRGRR